MRKISLYFCTIAVFVLSAAMPVSACWAPTVPFEISSEDGGRVFVFVPDEYSAGRAYAAVYEVLDNERQRLYAVEDLDSFAYEGDFYFSPCMEHFIRVFPAPGLSAFEVFSYGVRTSVVLRSDFIEDYESADHYLSIGPSFTVGWQIERHSYDTNLFIISTGEGNSFAFDIITAEFVDDSLPLWMQETPSSWAQESVERAGELGLLPESFRFGFGRNATRGEFSWVAIALYEHVREPVTGRITFADTTDPNVEKAAYLGIVSGVGDNRFDPYAEITREQAAVMLANLSEALGYPLPLWLMGLHPSTFIADYEDISPWAVQSVVQIYQAMVMGGIGDGMFAPQNPYTVEQSIVTIMRLFDMTD